MIPGVSVDAGHRFAERIHRSGQAIVWAGPREPAELYWQQLKRRRADDGPAGAELTGARDAGGVSAPAGEGDDRAGRGATDRGAALAEPAPALAGATTDLSGAELEQVAELAVRENGSAIASPVSSETAAISEPSTSSPSTGPLGAALESRSARRSSARGPRRSGRRDGS